MWSRGCRITCLLAAAALALPAGAWAQSAGDDQYQDPFAPGSGQTDGGGNGTDGSSDSGGADAPSAQPAPEPATPEPAAPEPAAPTTAPAPVAPAASAQELPRTGADGRLVALAGTVLLISGLALRRRSCSSAGRA
jgi:LPXTG-motif cell wall-anchored protein